MQNKRLMKLLDAILVPALAILSGLVLMAVLIAVTKKPIFESYGILFSKGFGCVKIGNCAILTTLERATPIILTGLSAVVAFRSGLFSIGQEGQFLVASVVAAWLGYSIHLPNGVHQIVIILACMAAGAAYGYIPGILKVKLGVNELLATIILNTIATLFIEYMVQFPLRADKATTAHSPLIDKTPNWQPLCLAPSGVWASSSPLQRSSFVFIFLWKTKMGYEQRMAGQAKRFALLAVWPAIKPPSAPC